MSGEKKRHQDIDWLKGLLVVLMIYCHVLQFWGNHDLFPAIPKIIESINMLVFPAFLFIFGRTTQLAYYQHPFKVRVPRMLKQTFLLYVTFLISGIGFRLLAENRSLKENTIKRILFLQDIPGWSEFLIAFALFSLLMTLGVRLWERLSKYSWFPFFFILFSLASAFLIPYEKIQNVFLSLWIGGTKYAYFPVIPYLMFPLVGLFYQKHFPIRKNIWLLSSALLSLSAIIYLFAKGLPSRFPPSPFWLLLPAFPILFLSLLSEKWVFLKRKMFQHLSFPFLKKILFFPGRILCHLGKHSLYFLLGSNLIIFTMKGYPILPVFSLKGSFLWKQSLSSPLGALVWTFLFLFLLILFLAVTGIKINSYPVALNNKTKTN